MAEFLVERGRTTLGSGTSSHTETAGTDYTTPGAAEDAFVTQVSSQHKTAADYTNGGPESLDDETSQFSFPTGDITDDFSFTRHATGGGCLSTWQLLNYIGAASGVNEFKVITVAEHHHQYNDTTITSSAISGITTLADCAVFIITQSANDSGTDNARCGFTAEIFQDGADFKVRTVKLDGSGTNTYVTYAVVEFTGSNWTVQKIFHTYTNDDTEEYETISTVGDVTRAFFEAQLRHEALNDNDTGQEVWFNSVTQLAFKVAKGADVSPAPVALVYVISNSETDSAKRMTVQHVSGTRAGDQTDPDDWNHTINEVASLSTACIMGLTCNGPEALRHLTNVIHARLTTTTNVALSRVESRSSPQDDIAYRFSVVQLPDSTAVGVTFVPKVIIS